MHLKDKTVRIKALDKSLLGTYQPPGIATQKEHLLDHLLDAMRHSGGIQFLHGFLGRPPKNIRGHICKRLFPTKIYYG